MSFDEIRDQYMPQARVFEHYADCNGISLDHEDDWGSHWNLFLAGVNWEDELAEIEESEE